MLDHRRRADPLLPRSRWWCVGTLLKSSMFLSRIIAPSLAHLAQHHLLKNTQHSTAFFARCTRVAVVWWSVDGKSQSWVMAESNSFCYFASRREKLAIDLSPSICPLLLTFPAIGSWMQEALVHLCCLVRTRCICGIRRRVCTIKPFRFANMVIICTWMFSAYCVDLLESVLRVRHLICMTMRLKWQPRMGLLVVVVLR